MDSASADKLSTCESRSSLDDIDGGSHGIPETRPDVLRLALQHLKPDMSEEERAVVEAEVLLKRYEETNIWQCLEDAMARLDSAIESTDDSKDEQCAAIEFVYSKCLRVRFMRGRNEDDLKQAISLAEDAVKRTERNVFSDRSALLIERKNQWALCIFTKAHQIESCQPNVLDEAIAIAEGVYRNVQETEAGEETLINTVALLGLFYHVRYDQRGTVQDLAQSIRFGYSNIHRLPSNSSYLMEALSDLACRMQRACLEHSRGTLTSLGDAGLPKAELWESETIDLICRAMEISPSRNFANLEQALAFMMYLKELPDRVRTSMLKKSSAFLQKLVKAFPDSVLLLGAYDQQDTVSTFYGMSRYAAASLLANDDCFGALEVLEIGRGVVLSILFNSNQELDDLSRSRPRLAEQYWTIRKNLRRANEGQPLMGHREALLAELNEVRATIRRENGFDDFDRPIREAKVVQLAQNSTVAIINITDIRSDVILVTSKGFRRLTLPELDEDDISEQSWPIQQLLAKSTKIEQQTTFPELHKRLFALLRSLWKSTVRPILDELGYKGGLSEQDEWPRICWIPTGILGLYPIHAAGPGLQAKDDTMRRVISSYAPTIKALYRSRSRWESMSEGSLQINEVVGIVMEDTPSRSKLELGPDEARILKTAFPATKFPPCMTKNEVLKYLKNGLSVAHFTCHGETDYSEPFKSMLLLQDWESNPLTVADLQQLELKEALLAVLSACFTANAGVENMQDEIIHLASALQVAGFVSVVGSLWYVGEKDALEVVKGFYQRLKSDAAGLSPGQVAKALHFAILDFRQSTRTAGNGGKGNPVAWSPFVHFGP